MAIDDCLERYVLGTNKHITTTELTITTYYYHTSSCTKEAAVPEK